MTRITFLGTGEAFDPNKSTTSYLIEHKGKTIMLDVGYDAAKSLMRLLAKQNRSLADVPNALLYTHFHGDHAGGTAALLMPIWEEVNGIVGKDVRKKERTLEILSVDPELEKNVSDRVSADYRIFGSEKWQSFWDKFKDDGPIVSFRTIDPQQKTQLYDFQVSAAPTMHSGKSGYNHAYRFDVEGMPSFAISGDGSFTPESRKLFSGIDLLIHEGFTVYDDSKIKGPNHASIQAVVEYAAVEKIPNVAIVHVNREQLMNKSDIQKMKENASSKNVYLFLPQDHEIVDVQQNKVDYHGSHSARIINNH